MAAAVNQEAKKCNAAFTPLRSENYMILSTTYPLNNSDTKRIQVGLRPVSEEETFEVVIKLAGSSSAGIYFNRETWQEFQDNMESAGEYLRGIIRGTPNPISLKNISINFTTAYGERAIMLNNRQKTPENKEEVKTKDSEGPQLKKRKTYGVSIVMQRSSFEGLESVIKCINARYEQLNSLVHLVNDTSRFLITEIELSLPKRSLDVGVVKQTLIEQYQEIQGNVQRQLKNLDFLDAHFEILFHELTSLHLYEIVRTIISNKIA